MNLFDINHEIDETLAKYTDKDTGEIFQEGFDAIEGIMVDRAAKILSIAAAMKNKKAFASAVDEEVKKLKAKSAAATNSYESMQNYLTEAMEPDEKVSDARCSVRVGSYEYVNVTSFALLPPEFWREYEPKAASPDKTKIRDMLMRGNGVPGAEMATKHKAQVK